MVCLSRFFKGCQILLSPLWNTLSHINGPFSLLKGVAIIKVNRKYQRVTHFANIKNLDVYLESTLFYCHSFYSY